MPDRPVRFSAGIQIQASKLLDEAGIVARLLGDSSRPVIVSEKRLSAFLWIPHLTQNESPSGVLVGVSFITNDQTARRCGGFYSHIVNWLRDGALGRLGPIAVIEDAIHDPIDNEYLLPEEARGKLEHLLNHIRRIGSEIMKTDHGEQVTVPLASAIQTLRADIVRERTMAGVSAVSFMPKYFAAMDQIAERIPPDLGVMLSRENAELLGFIHKTNPGHTGDVDTSDDGHEHISDNDIARRLHPGLDMGE